MDIQHVELDPHRLDLVLVEGYKHAAFPKIELHRSGLQKPLLFPCDSNIIAIAADRPIATILPQLDLNQPGEIAAFILEFVAAHPGDLRSCQTSR
ncbi:MAG TPA: hypothetical protein EYP90_01240 [Chromatiaceae bacterium]|nr:hypothetical protein [Chromatiaceae bacterium]